MTKSVYAALQDYLTKLGMAEYRTAIAAHRKAGRKDKTYRHDPSPYHRALVLCLGANDEVLFKSIKDREGYACALGY